ncbi:MAG: hypothetical protein WC346_00250 [Methanogenium sp.]|jgi:hypothetical protein
MNKLFALRDAVGNPVFGLNLSNYPNAVVLAANVAKSHNVPSGAKRVNISATKDFFADFSGETAVIPTEDITDGTSSILNPTLRSIEGVESISFIAEEATVITLEFYG